MGPAFFGLIAARLAASFTIWASETAKGFSFILYLLLGR